MILPNHIEKKSEVWYYNTKTGKYLHKDFIEDFCNKYWEQQDRIAEQINNKSNEALIEKKFFFKEMKNARKRWGL